MKIHLSKSPLGVGPVISHKEIFQTFNSDRSISQSLNCQRITPSGYKARYSDSKISFTFSFCLDWTEIVTVKVL